MNRNLVALTATALVVALAPEVQAQGPSHHESWPVDLNLQSVTGHVVVDSLGAHPAYFLDEDGDSGGDVLLGLGPWWYEPETGADRPKQGEEITVVGHLIGMGDSAILVVFEIDGVTWRNAAEYGMHGWNQAEVWLPTPDTATVGGTILVDTTYFYRHYYLDTDDDSIPEYQLVFGPPWYLPEGAQLPEAGAFVTVFGSVKDTFGLTRLTVYELNGEVWRRLGEPAPWAGRWMEQNHADTAFVPCVNDSASWIAFPPGNTPGGMGPMHWPDSMFVQFTRIPPDSLPGDPHASRFAGFFVDVDDPMGESMMGRTSGGHRGMMTFAKVHAIRLHYHDEDIDANHEAGVRAMFWDEETSDWKELPGIALDVEANSVLLYSADLGRYYALVSDETTTHVADAEDMPESTVSLLTNYPNPFRGVTSIVFELSSAQNVMITVYDLMGRRVATVVDATRTAGIHHEAFDSSSLGSGMYVYRLEIDGITTSRPMIVVD